VPEFLVELYISRTDARGLADAAEALGPTVRCVRSIFVPADELGYLLVEATSANAVRDAALAAGLLYERIGEVAAPPEATVVTDA
jgi:hypothetical protein